MIWLLSLLAFLSLLGAALCYWQGVLQVEKVLAPFAVAEGPTTGFWQRRPPWLGSLLRPLAPLGQRLSAGPGVARRLVLAGSPWQVTVLEFSSLKAGLGLLALGLAVLASGLGLGLLGYLLLVPALFGPDWLLKYLGAQRQQAMARALPDFLDAMATSLGAGVGLEVALGLVSSRLGGPLGEAFGEVCRQLDLGTPREAALRGLLERVEVKELQSFVGSWLQGASLGVPVAQTFTIYAQNLRHLRAQWAKEQAGKAAPKITLITSFLITPAALLLIVGLLVLNVLLDPAAFGLEDFL